MILYYRSKFHFNTMNSFRVMGRGHFPPPARPRHSPKKPGTAWVNSRILEQKKLQEHLRGGGSIGAPRLPSSIHPFAMIFSTYEIPLFFQLSVTTWCLICFDGNHSCINDVTSCRHLGFLIFQSLFKLES